MTGTFLSFWHSGRPNAMPRTQNSGFVPKTILNPLPNAQTVKSLLTLSQTSPGFYVIAVQVF